MHTHSDQFRSTDKIILRAYKKQRGVNTRILYRDMHKRIAYLRSQGYSSFCFKQDHKNYYGWYYTVNGQVLK